MAMMYMTCLILLLQDLWNRHDSWSTNHHTFSVNVDFKRKLQEFKSEFGDYWKTCSMFGFRHEEIGFNFN